MDIVEWYAVEALERSGIRSRAELHSFLQSPDRNAHYRLYEAACALKYALIPWMLIPPYVFESRNLHRVHQTTGAMFGEDFGIDCASYDFATTLQAKWYDPAKSKIKYCDVAKFVTASQFAGATRRLLVSPFGVEFDRSQCEDRDELFTREYLDMGEMFGILAKHLPAECNAGPTETETTLETRPELSTPRSDDEAVAVFFSALRDYQRQAINDIIASLNRGSKRLLCEIGCGGGKTRIILAVAAQWVARGLGPIALVVPSNTTLMYQIRVEATELIGMHPGLVGDGQCEIKDVTLVCAPSIDRYLSQVKPTLIIHDEGHHVMRHLKSDTGFYARCAQAAGQHVYFTATPEETAEHHEVECVVRISAGFLIDKGHLCDYKVWVPHFGKFLTEDGDETECGTYLRALAQLTAETPAWRRILAYCNTIASCKKFAELLNEVNVRAVHIEGSTPIEERRRIFGQLESGEIACVVSVRTISEGLNIPLADTCMFAEPRMSETEVTQCLGRVMRKDPRKSIAHVVVPSTHAPALSLVFNRLQRSTPQLARAVNEKIYGRVGIVASRVANAKVYAEAAAAMKMGVYTSLGQFMHHAPTPEQKWSQMLQLLAEYQMEMGTVPSTDEIYKESKLGAWCVTQRSQYRAKKLSDDKIASLEAIPGWAWSLQEQSWQNNYRELKQYVAANSRLPPSSSELGKWCTRQRQIHIKRYVDPSKGATGSMSPERKAALEAISVWKW